MNYDGLVSWAIFWFLLGIPTGIVLYELGQKAQRYQEKNCAGDQH